MVSAGSAAERSRNWNWIAAASLRRFAGYFLAWTAAGLFFFTQDLAPRLYRNDPTPWTQLFTGWMAAIYLCAAFAPFILWLGRRWPIPMQGWPSRVALHFLFASIFSVIEIAVETPVLVAMGLFDRLGERATFSNVFPMLLVVGFHGNIIRYWLLLGLQAAVRAWRTAGDREREALQLRAHSSELAAQLSGARLNALKMQLHPHFLFNTLGAIMVLVRKGDARQAETMLVRLSGLLRAVLEEGETREVPLSRELDFLQTYLSIEQVRFEDRLRVGIRHEAETAPALLPHLILQPIVENAIRHGLGRSEEAVLIEIDVARRGDRLVVVVRDDGPGSAPAALNSNGIGLANTKNRLQQMYGPLASLAVESRQPHGVAVTLSLPFHTQNVEEERG